MDKTQFSVMRRSLNEKATTELLQIWTTNDRQEWSSDAFEAIGQLLAERGEPLPKQTEHETLMNGEHQARIAQAIATATGLQPSLRSWFRAYLCLLLAGFALWIAGAASNSGLVAGLGGLLVLAALIPYIGSIVYAYRLQSVLNSAGLYKHGAWQVIVGALLLNPWVLGFWIPLSVASTVRKVLAASGSRAVSPT